ncbi:MAG: ROK family protein, partial [Comamonadaceae bacterium]
MTRWDELSDAEMELLQAIFWSAGVSRHRLAGRLGYSRSKANALVSGLLEQGVLDETGLQDSSGGRRPETLKLSPGLGVVLGADLGATSLDVAVMRPDLSILAHHAEPADVRAGPAVVLARVRTVLRQLLKDCGAGTQQVIGIGMGVPGPV